MSRFHCRHRFYLSTGTTNDAGKGVEDDKQSLQNNGPKKAFRSLGTGFDLESRTNVVVKLMKELESA